MNWKFKESWQIDVVTEGLNIILILQIITITNEQHIHTLKLHKILNSE